MNKIYTKLMILIALVIPLSFNNMFANAEEITNSESKWIPKLEHRVTDLSDLLSEKERRTLINILEKYEKETAHQIFILTVPTLHGESIDSFSLRVANAWGVGFHNLDNGVLVTVAPNEKNSRIEVGYGLEPFITDNIAGYIMSTHMIPYFRKGDYYNGIKAGILSLMKVGRQYVIPPDKWPTRLNKD